MRTKWPRVRVGDVGEVLGGKQKVLAAAPGTPRPYLRVANVFDGHIDHSDVLAMPFTDIEFTRFVLQPGDVLLNEGQSLELVGRAARYDGPSDTYAYQNSLIRFRPGPECDPHFAEALFRHLQQSGAFMAVAARTTSIAHLGVSRFAAMSVALPPRAVQNRLARVAQATDGRASALGELLTAKRRLKRALMQRHLLQAARHPRAPLGRVAHESRKRNDGALGLPAVMGVIKGQGLVPMRDGMAASDLSRYLLVPPSAFAYNPMRINIGSIACSRRASNVLVSPDYVVFTCDESRLLPRYLDHLRHSQAWCAFVGRAGSGSVRVRIYFEHLAQFVFHLPPLAEQRAIVRALDLLDDELASLKSLLAALRLQKRGVMQKLLSGEIALPDVSTAPGAPAPEAESAP